MKYAQGLKVSFTDEMKPHWLNNVNFNHVLIYFILNLFFTMTYDGVRCKSLITIFLFLKNIYIDLLSFNSMIKFFYLYNHAL